MSGLFCGLTINNITLILLLIQANIEINDKAVKPYNKQDRYEKIQILTFYTRSCGHGADGAWRLHVACDEVGLCGGAGQRAAADSVRNGQHCVLRADGFDVEVQRSCRLSFGRRLALGRRAQIRSRRTRAYVPARNAGGERRGARVQGFDGGRQGACRLLRQYE